MLEQIPEPGPDAFKGGFLEQKYGAKVIKRINRKTKVVANGFPNGQVFEAEQDRTIDLSPMLAGVPCYLINNGELRYCKVVLRFEKDPNA